LSLQDSSYVSLVVTLKDLLKQLLLNPAWHFQIVFSAGSVWQDKKETEKLSLRTSHKVPLTFS
jgi:hypothetical protein